MNATSRSLTLTLALVLGTLAFLAIPQASWAQERRDPIVGSFDWSNGAVVTFHRDGRVTMNEAVGQWRHNPYGGYIVVWNTGYLNRIKLCERDMNRT